ncbi:DUF3515 family protein [Plantactinospora sp. BB1]|uniref:DUF3515 family protein n=1 Tax=Plantactinospora sp. BB1 TaxID=2071627 RepID=UPI000D16B0A4|nr:DUF3515 family protein [Plantactinospora sp. BB1]AVT37342.1 DUF3515 domain-containing protein [Plantactinospora sp. BB1]
MARSTRPSQPEAATTGPADRPAEAGPDRTTRQAALWATVVALPLTALVAVLVFGQLSPDPVAKPAPTPTSAAPQASTPVQMAAPTLAERPATVCRALLSRLPATLRSLGQRPVTAGPEQNAAYGDPAITLACGVAPPAVPDVPDLWMVNNVCWLTEHRDGGLVLTTVDREVPVRLSVPAGQEQTVQWAAPVSESLVASVPSLPQIPSGCTGG